MMERYRVLLDWACCANVNNAWNMHASTPISRIHPPTSCSGDESCGRQKHTQEHKWQVCLSRMTTLTTLSSLPILPRGCRLLPPALTCSHSSVRMTPYDASVTLRKAIKSHVAAPSLIKAIQAGQMTQVSHSPLRLVSSAQHKPMSTVLRLDGSTCFSRLRQHIDWGNVNFERGDHHKSQQRSNCCYLRGYRSDMLSRDDHRLMHGDVLLPMYNIWKR